MHGSDILLIDGRCLVALVPAMVALPAPLIDIVDPINGPLWEPCEYVLPVKLFSPPDKLVHQP